LNNIKLDYQYSW